MLKYVNTGMFMYIYLQILWIQCLYVYFNIKNRLLGKTFKKS